MLVGAFGVVFIGSGDYRIIRVRQTLCVDPSLYEPEIFVSLSNLHIS
jgi:hypothetical protein